MLSWMLEEVVAVGQEDVNYSALQFRAEDLHIMHMKGASFYPSKCTPKLQFARGSNLVLPVGITGRLGIDVHFQVFPGTRVALDPPKKGCHMPKQSNELLGANEQTR